MAGGELGTMTLRVGGEEITTWQEYSFNSHFLTPTDGFRFVVGDEQMSPALQALLVAGQKVTLTIDGVVQSTGYIDVVDPSGDRHSGNVVVLEGRDTMSRAVDAQIDPSHRYPDKTPLDKLIQDVLTPFGFSRFEISNEANVQVAANKAISKRKRKPKKLKEYPIPKGKPRHNETFFVFLSRITQRYGLWIWPTVDGNGVVVSSPDFDQLPAYQIRRKAGAGPDDSLRRFNNVLRGGVRRDSTDQPSYIVATGNVPATEHSVTRTRVVIDNPVTGDFEPGVIPGVSPFAATTPNKELAFSGEGGSFSEAVIRRHTEEFKYTYRVPTPPMKLANPFASLVARPRYMKDDESHTLDELQKFALRQMSLCTRRAVVGKYTIMGHKLDGVPIQVDTVIDIDDDRSNWHGPMWVISRTFNKSRNGGTTTDIEAIPLHSLVF